MTKYTPVHIIYDTPETITDAEGFIERMINLANRLQGDPSPLLSLVRAGKVIAPLSVPDAFRKKMHNNDSQVDLKTAFERVKADLIRHTRMYDNAYVLVILGEMPVDDWKDVRAGLRSYHTHITALWVSKNKIEFEAKRKLEVMLKSIGDDYSILESEGSKVWDQVFDKFQTDIAKRNSQQPALSSNVPTKKRDSTAPVRGFNGSTLPSNALGRETPQASSVLLGQANSLKVESTKSVVSDMQSKISNTSNSEPISGSGDSKLAEATASVENRTQSITQPKPPPAKWEKREPVPSDPTDPYPHEYNDNRDGYKGWFILGSSRRGRLHEHEATYREDAFAIEKMGNWHLVAVADGAGSHRLSRRGSNLAVQTAIEAMKNIVGSQSPSESVASKSLQDGLKEAWKALYKEAESRKINFKDLSTTLLLLSHNPAKNLLAVAQVGDGLIAAQLENGEVKILGDAESGEYSGQTMFLTNYIDKDLLAKVKFVTLSNPVSLFLVMTDGVSDDFYPPQDRLPLLIKHLPGVLDVPTGREKETALYNLIGYERSGSFDDRTLVLLCQPEKMKQMAQSTTDQSQPKSSEPSGEKAPEQSNPKDKPVDPSPIATSGSGQDSKTAETKLTDVPAEQFGVVSPETQSQSSDKVAQEPPPKDGNNTQ